MPDAVPGRRRVRLPVELRADAAARGRAEEQRQLRADVPADRVRGPAARGRADAPRQLLRVSRPSTTTSPSPGGTAALYCAQVPSSPLSVLSRFTRSGAVLPSSFGALLPRPRNEPLFVEFLVSCRRRRFAFYYEYRNVETASGLETLASKQAAHPGQRHERLHSWLGRVAQRRIVVIYTCSIALSACIACYST